METALAVISIVMSALGGASNILNTEKSGRNADTISALYDKALDYYNRVQNGYNVKVSELTNMLNDLRNAQMSMTGTPRALVTAAIDKATKKLNMAQELSTNAANKINSIYNEKATKLQNEAAHISTAMFRKERNAGNVTGDLMSDDAMEGLIAAEQGRDVTKEINSNLINAGADTSFSSQPKNINNNIQGGTANVQKK